MCIKNIKWQIKLSVIIILKDAISMKKVILTAALTGGIHGKELNPNMPEQPDEIVQQAVDSANAGATVIHVHIRDARGKPSADTGIFADVQKRIKSKTDAIVQLTTGGGLGVSVEDRIKIIDTKPEMASLNTTTCVFFHEGKEILYQNFRSEIELFAERMLESGVIPELECYNLASIDEVYNLIKKGLIKKPYYVNMVLGIPAQGGLRATPENLMIMHRALPEDSIFNVTAIGSAQLPLTTMSVILGGNCRVGMEDNIFYKKNVLVENNAQLVERAVRIIKELNYEVASPDEARDLLNIRK
jgi:3-keto-5-aminohexanoate cleavage enzyme